MAEKLTELFEMFCVDVKDEVEKLCGCEVEIREVTNNNNVKREVLYFKRDGSSPLIYLRPYFDINFVENKETINYIAKQIYEVYEKNRSEKAKYDVENALTNWSDYIYLEVVNYKKNKEMLKSLPHIRFLDLAIVFRLLLHIDEVGRASMRLNEIPHGSNLDEMYNIAKENTLKFFGVVNRNIYDLLASMGEDVDKPIFIDSSMYVLTNKTSTGGANLIAIPEVLNGVCDEFDIDSCYIIPSSTNELIIIYGIDDAFVGSMYESIKFVNDSCVPGTQILSYNLYRFSAETGLVTIVE